MRRLRKTGETHRGLRPGLLAGILLVAAAAGVVAGLSACTAAHPAPDATAGWYQLQAGSFQKPGKPGDGLAVSFRPWTVQGRVADVAFLDGTLYCGINGAGLAGITLDAAGTPSFTYHLDSLIFAHRTVTTLIPRPAAQGSAASALTVHLYYNALLNDTPPQDLTLTGISLVNWLPAKADFSFLIPPFQKKNPDWEAVGFAPLTAGEYELEWKFTSAGETRFAYTRFNADSLAESGVTREAYLDALGVPAISGDGVPADLAAFFGQCRDALGPSPSGTALLFTVRTASGAVRRSFRSAPQSDAAVLIPVFEETGARWALLPGGKVLGVPATGARRTVELPALPRGFRYTDLAKSGSFLVVPWEETRFTDVGRAGILVYRLN
jgi:hypothetical protein